MSTIVCKAASSAEDGDLKEDLLESSDSELELQPSVQRLLSLGENLDSAPCSSAFMKACSPFIDLQHFYVHMIANHFFTPAESTMHVSSSTGQIVIPLDIYCKCALVWVLGAILAPLVMPCFAVQVLVVAWKDNEESLPWNHRKSLKQGKRVWNLKSVEYVLIFAMSCAIILCTFALIPGLVLMTRCTFEARFHISVVELWAPMACSSLCSLALSLHVLSLCMVITAKDSFEGETRQHRDHGFDTGDIHVFTDYLRETEDVLRNGFSSSGKYVFRMWRESRREDLKLAKIAAGLTSFESVAKTAFHFRRACSSWTVVKTVLVLSMMFTPLAMGVPQDPSESDRKPSEAHGACWADCHAAAVAARCAYCYISGATTYVLLTVCESALREAKESRQFTLLLLCLAATQHTRKLLHRLFKRDLDMIIDHGITTCETSLHTLFTFDREGTIDHGVQMYDSSVEICPSTLESSTYAIMRDKFCPPAARELDLYVGAAENATEAGRERTSWSASHPPGSAVHPLTKFRTVDLGLFWLFRKKLKAYSLTIIMQIQLFLMALFASAVFVFVLGYMCSLNQKMNMELLMATGVFLVVVVVTVLVFNDIIELNFMMNELTVGLLLQWKDLFESIRSQIKHVPANSVEKKTILLEYFQQQKREVAHIIEQVKESEAPISFFGFPITRVFRNTLVVTALSVAASNCEVIYEKFRFVIEAYKPAD